MPPRAKKVAAHEKSVNSHHSNAIGLAQPGRRIPRLKSSAPNLHTQASIGANGISIVSPAISATSESSPILLDGAEDSATIATGHVNGLVSDHQNMGTTQSLLCRGRAVSFTLQSDMDSPVANGVDGHVPYNPTTTLRIDVNAGAAASKQKANNKGAFATATTILTAYPLLDVIMLLIVLLQFPPAAVGFIHFLFTCITFTPSAPTASFNSIQSFADVFFGNAGNASIPTIMTVDVMAWIVFAFLWPQAQNFVLDLAHAVIAISLGGAATSKGGTTSSMFCCLVVIALSHLARCKPIQQLFVNFVWPELVRRGFATESTPPRLSEGVASSMTSGYVTKLLGVHILAQGITRMIRRYIYWSKSLEDDPAYYKKVDPEPSSSPSLTPRSAKASPDLRAENAISSSSDTRPFGPSPSSKERSGGKKKKKMSTQVRMQQPFWAALASTKVNVYKDGEQAYAETDAKTAHSADASSMGSVDFSSLLERVWIMEVSSTEISFGVCLPLVLDDGMDSKPDGVYVRVNGAMWISVKKRMMEGSKVEAGVEYKGCEGRIYGLTPLSTYHCEFLRESDDVVIYQTTLITQPATSTETAVISTPPTTLQPSSPTTTLRNSLHAEEVECDKSKNRLKAARKQHKTVLDRLISQTERENGKLSNNGGTDERQRQRAKQLENSIQKIKSDIIESENSLEELRQIPPEDMAKYSEAKSEARDRQRRRDSQKSRHDKAKKEADKDVACAKGDIDSILHKRSRFESRQKEYLSKLNELGKKNEQATLLQSKKVKEKRDREAARRAQQQNLEDLNGDLQRQIVDAQKSHADIAGQVQQYEEWSNLQAAGASAPATPEAISILPAPTLAFNPAALIASSGATSSLPGSRPSSLHVNSSGSGGYPLPMSATSGVNGLSHSRRRASSLEIESFPSLYQNAFINPGIAAAAAAAAAAHSDPTTASSAALLANSTALAPPSFGSGLGLVNGHAHYNPGSVVLPAPVGAEKYRSRRKSSSSGGSRGSISGGIGAIGPNSGNNPISALTGIPLNGNSATNTGNSSPRFGGLKLNVNGNALASTPSPPALWERRLNVNGLTGERKA